MLGGGGAERQPAPFKMSMLQSSGIGWLVEDQAQIGVFLLADNRLLREALTRTFNKKRDLTVVGSCPFSNSAIDEVSAVEPDVLVMDAFPASAPHLEFLRDLRRHAPDVKLILIAMDRDEQSFLQAVREGVTGYVLANASALEVVAVVRAVAAGEGVCPPEFCGVLFRCVAHQSRCVPSFQVKTNLGLTAREQQVVLLISRGLTNKEIAAQLSLAEQTVRNHVHRMLQKTGVSDRLAVVEMCRMEGLPV
jgi:DNA-binding NarL/FixJ family response regulator